jgi:uncharacterized repeat protein (TIGR03847 family)
MSSSPSFELDAPDHFTAGAVGEPGERVFFLQARESSGGALVTLRSEKEQVRVLSEYLSRLLSRLPSAREDAPPDLDLIEPLEPAWVVASIGLGYDEASDRILIEASEFVEEEGDEPATARFRITRGQATGFVVRAQELMKGGRPLCPFCSQPMDPGGHICPRSNGHIVH